MATVELDQLRNELDEKKDELTKLVDSTEGARMDEAQRDAYNRLNAEIDELGEHIREREIIDARLRDIAGESNGNEAGFNAPSPRAVRGNDIWDTSTIRMDSPEAHDRDLNDRAKRAIEASQYPHPRANREDVQANLERLLGDGEGRRGRDVARYILATGSREYKRAFAKYLGGGEASLTDKDREHLSRAMSLTTTSGGFAVPFVLDPSVIQTGSGAINPYRSVASVVTQSVDEWRGVSSAGVTATFQAEAAAVTDASPTLAQPTVSTEMARAFIPFSIEIGQDWDSFQSEMANMIQDAKDVLEATKFATGNGTNEPFGVITGATTVFTASNTNSLVVADIYGVHNALGPRFRRNASWTMNNAVADRIRQLDTAGGANLWVDNLTLRSAAVPNSFTDGRMGAQLLGKSAYEATGQSGTFTTGQLIAVVGDFSYYKIVDRIGLNIEVIPHIFGAAQGNLPTGQRGLFGYWRVGAKVLDPNAFRTLKLA